MMFRLLLASGILVTSVVSPTVAHAYVPPQDVLNEEDFSTTYYSAPPSTREIDAAQQEQQRRSAERREAEQAAAMNQQSSSEPTEEDLHGAAPDEEEMEANDLQELIDALNDLNEEDASNEAMTAEELREQRTLARIRAQQLEAERAAQYGWMNALGDENLHSGAPLTETGPTTVIIVLAIAGAIGETWRRVKKADRK